MADDVHVLRLQVPIDVDGDQVSEIRIRRPLVRDHLLAARGSASVAERDVALVRIVSGLKEQQVREMDLGDMFRAQDVVANFLASGTAKPKS